MYNVYFLPSLSLSLSLSLSPSLNVPTKSRNTTGESVPQMKEALLISTFDSDSSNKMLEEKLDINGVHRVNTLFSGMCAYNIIYYINVLLLLLLLFLLLFLLC